MLPKQEKWIYQHKAKSCTKAEISFPTTFFRAFSANHLAAASYSPFFTFRKTNQEKALKERWKSYRDIAEKVRGKSFLTDTDASASVSKEVETQAKAAFLETVSLFSADQIREEESPWKALSDISKQSRAVRKGSFFKRKLQERKKLRILYGHLPQRTLSQYLRCKHRPEDLLIALESRLDIVLKRAAFFPSIQSARKAILKGGVFVNHNNVRSPRYHCVPGDCIQIAQKSCYELPLLFTTSEKHFKQEKDQLPDSISFQDLFANGELLSSFNKRTGRLYGSTHSHLEGIKSNTFSRAFEKEKRLLERLNLSESDTVPFFKRAPFNSTPPSTSLFKSFPIPTSAPTFVPATGDTNVETRKGQRLKTEKIVNDMAKESSCMDQPVVANRVKAELSSSREVASRPLHLEVSYRSLSVVFLYPPQRLCLDISIDLSLVC